VGLCPGVGQDRVNFHQKPGRGTARRVDPTWPTRAEYSTPCAVMLGSGWRKLGSAKAVAAQERAAAVGGESGSLCSAVLCCVFCLSVSFLLLFPLFAVLLSCSYPDPPVFVCFSFYSPPHSSGGRGGRVALVLPAAAKK